MCALMWRGLAFCALKWRALTYSLKPPTVLTCKLMFQVTTDQGTYINDLGQIANETMNVVEASEALLSLTASQKYSLLTNHYKPDPKFLFPKTFSNGCKWSFQLSWLHKYPWLVYSKELNGGFCKFCALFVVKDRNLLGVLVNKPFKNRVKVRFSCLSQVS